MLVCFMLSMSRVCMWGAHTTSGLADQTQSVFWQQGTSADMLHQDLACLSRHAVRPVRSVFACTCLDSFGPAGAGALPRANTPCWAVPHMLTRLPRFVPLHTKSNQGVTMITGGA